jgi:hypothetical protein
MKCDGPSVVPCRGCKASGQPCIFEARSRPKSISVIPASRQPYTGPSLYTSRPRPPSSLGRSGTPTAFYPAGPQPAPPVTTSSSSLSVRPGQTREPMPPPSGSSSSMAGPSGSAGNMPSGYVPQPRSAGSHSYSQSYSSGAVYHPAPLQLPPFSTATQGMSMGSGPGPPPSMSLSHPHPSTPSSESRLRSLESAVRNFSTQLPTSIHNIQASLNHLQRSQDNLTATIIARSQARTVEVTDIVWENYRNGAWPLTPWLVGLREAQGLPGLVVIWLGRKTELNSAGGAGKQDVEVAEEMVRAEVGRLVSIGNDWSREEIRALGIFA